MRIVTIVNADNLIVEKAFTGQRSGFHSKPSWKYVVRTHLVKRNLHTIGKAKMGVIIKVTLDAVNLESAGTTEKWFAE